MLRRKLSNEVTVEERGENPQTDELHINQLLCLRSLNKSCTRLLTGLLKRMRRTRRRTSEAK